ncbi:hypothetical protein [Nonomuraea sp. NEAU-A123]|uniref:hypothetical protein n=1 Tax=Nonomuraea sp. NEAU-A123 TaxID=2839649 RepID=UPI001BE43975|nr:hypothetical protein [Nonomuraea sp. NEAU-A123]MBT2226141.1 hypothetical protein [Nonomuraea sp. NEAU-A123]
MRQLPASRVWRRFVRHASALWLVGAVIALALPSPAQALADKTLTLAYTCTGGPFTDTSLSVPLTLPDTATGTFDVKWRIPALTLRTPPNTTTQVHVAGKLAVTGGTHTDLEKTGASVTTGSTSVLAGQVTSTVSVTATTGDEVTVKGATDQGSLKLSLASAPSDVTSCTTTSTTSVVVTVGQGTGTDTGTGDLVTYSCKTGTEATPQTVKIRVTLTMPTSAPKTGEQFSIGWAGTYETGSELEAPSTGLPAGSKLYAYASISGLSQLTSATGVGELGTVTAGGPITLPTSVDMKTTSKNSGSATVKPAAINIGTSPTVPTIECEVQSASALKTYPLTIGAGSKASSTPDPEETPSSTPKAKTSSKTSKTPKAGADTGAGGDAGPDGRMFVLTGTALMAAAGIGGLLMRRRSAAKP